MFANLDNQRLSPSASGARETKWVCKIGPAKWRLLPCSFWLPGDPTPKKKCTLKNDTPLEVDCTKSVQPSFLSKISCFPWMFQWS